MSKPMHVVKVICNILAAYFLVFCMNLLDKHCSPRQYSIYACQHYYNLQHNTIIRHETRYDTETVLS